MRQEPEKLKQRLWSLPETGGKITCPEDRPEKNSWNRQGRENTSTCQPASFQTKKMVIDTSGSGQHDSNDTNRGKVSGNGMRPKQEAENSGGTDQE